MLPEKHSPVSLQMLAVILALVATTLFTLAENDGSSGWLIVAGWITVQSLLLGVGAWWFRRLTLRMTQPPAVSPLVVLIVLLTLGWELMVRWLEIDFLGIQGHSMELVLMTTAKNLLLVLTVFSVFPHYQKLCVLKSLFLAIFSATLTTDRSIIVGLAIYSLLAVIWLVLMYWESLRERIVPESRTKLPWRWLSGLVSMVLLILMGLGGGSNQAVHALKGFVPGSGGTGELDLFARGGVNDGDMLIAGTENIQSFAPIENAPFLQDERPALYDVFDDSYDEPVKKTKQDRAISLDPSLFEKGCKQMARSKQASREFSTLRKQKPRKTNGMKDINSQALMYLKGRAPLHLRLEVFDLFDGRDWYPVKLLDSPLPFTMRTIEGKPWLPVARHPLSNPFLSKPENRSLKIINLDTNRIPTPPHATGVHIDQVDRADMFKWAQPGIVQMDRDKLPELVAIHLASQTLDQEELRQTDRAEFGFSGTNCHELPNTDEMREIGQLAESWVSHLPHGWQQVQALQNHLREHYIRDRNAKPPVDSQRSPLGWFLLESKTGPDYLFATAACLMLRKLGYSTRLVSGFYVDPARYEPRSQHIPIMSEDVHFWCEVYIGLQTWATVEPTPGYEISQPPPTYWDQCLATIKNAGLFLLRHWIIWIIALLTSGLLWWFRLPLLDRVCLLSHHLWHQTSSQQTLGALRILERRLCWLSHARPAGVTVRQWFDRLLLHQHCPQISRFLNQVDQVVFSPRSVPVGNDISEEVLQKLSLSTLRQLLQSNSESILIHHSPTERTVAQH